MSYTHMSQDERYPIQHVLSHGFSTREIGASLKRAAAAISRELRRCFLQPWCTSWLNSPSLFIQGAFGAERGVPLNLQ